MRFRQMSSMDADEQALQQILGDFRASVHAWSEAESSRPRMAASAAHRRSWRMALAGALGCVIAAGSLAGGLYQRHQREETARMAAERNLELQQRLAAQQRAQADEELFAAIDSDVSREVPSAMEPLAQLMDGNGNQ